MPLPNLPPRVCACGCGVLYTPKRSDQKYATQTCKMRAYRARKHPSWFALLTESEQASWASLRQNSDPALVRAALLVELDGRANGVKAARRCLAQVLWIFGVQSGDWLLDNLWQYYPDGLVDEVTAGAIFASINEAFSS